MKRILNFIIKTFKTPTKRAVEDIFLIFAIVLLSIVFALNVQEIKVFAFVSDKFDFFHSAQGHYHINAMVFLPIAIFMLGLIWYSWRRWREIRVSEIELEKMVTDRTSELQRFRDLIDQTNDAIIIADPLTARIVEFNERACKNLGYTKEELLDMKITDIEITIPSMRLWNKHAQKAKKKKTIVLEGMRKRKDGTTFPAEVTVNYVSYKNKEYMVGIIHDISDRIEAEDALKESEERFRSLTEASPDWIWAMDAQCSYTYVSPKIKDTLGYKPEEIIGKTPFDLMPPKEARRVSMEFRYYDKNKIPFERLENINIHKNGKEVVLETSGTPLFDDEENIIGWQGVDRDITERKELEEEFSIQSAQMKKLFEDSPEAMVIWDDEGRVIKVNDKFVELFGFTRQELIGKSTNPLIVPKEFTAEGLFLSKEVMKGKTIETEAIRKRKDGERVEVSIIVHPIKFNKNELIAYGIYRDITDRKEMERDLSVQQAYMEKLFQESPEAIALLDNEANILKINKNFVDLFGYSEKDSLGKNLDNLIVPKKLQKEAVKVTKQIIVGKTIDFETTRCNKKGQEIMVSLLGHPITLNENQLAIYVIYRDITKQKQAYEKILDSYKHLGIVNRQIEILSGLLKFDVKDKQKAIEFVLKCGLNFSREDYSLLYKYNPDIKEFELLKALGVPKEERMKIQRIPLGSWPVLHKIIEERQHVFRTNMTKELKKLYGLNLKVGSILILPIQKDNKTFGAIVLGSADKNIMTDSIDFYDIFAVQASHLLGKFI